MMALPEINMANAMSEGLITSVQFAVQPTILTRDDGVLMPFDMVPGAIVSGGIGPDGRPNFMPFQDGARVDIGEELLEQRRKLINDIFGVSLFQILVEQPQMTATEVLQRAREKAALLTPAIGRQQSEFLGPLIHREMAILFRQGVLPPPPPALLEVEYEVEYTTEVSRMQRAEEGLSILRTMEQLQPIAAYDPTVLKIFKPMEVARVLSDINGVPAKVLADEFEVEETLSAANQAARMAQMTEVGTQAAGAVADLARAGVIPTDG